MADQNHPKTPAYENDVWTVELEELGFDREATELARMILQCRPPFAISVRGRWGSGKTSIMRYAMAYLGSKDDPIRLPLQGKDVEDCSSLGMPGVLQGIIERGKEALGKLGFVPLESAYADDGKKPVEVDDTSRTRVTCVWFSPWRYQNDPNPMVPLLHTMRHHFSRWARTRRHLGRAASATIEAGLETLGYLADSAASLEPAVMTCGFRGGQPERS